MRVGLGEFHSICRNVIKVGRVEVVGSITASVESALVIGIKNDNVGFGAS